ncbi:PKD domain-containing protein, partial [Candidatus Woesearchaeota archaeon]|nr:PKD domain-containing protein [Candidatus Woesearchaeota archaeon]
MKIAKILLYIFLLLVLSSTLVYAQTVTINPSNPVDNDDLSCDIENVQNSNRPFYTYRWYVNGQRDYSVGNTWIYPASRTRVNDRITCFASIPGGIILGSASVTISAVQVNQPPTVRITNPSIGSRFFVNQPITFNTVTSDPENDPLTFTWDFGDGSASGGANPIHTYTLPGTYTVTVVVSDNVNTARDSVVINIVQIMPMNQ